MKTTTNAIATRSGTTFRVSRVLRARQLLEETPYHKAVVNFLGSPVEACSQADSHSGRTLLSGVQSHPLIGALHHGFASHRPVSLSPDMIWLTLCQGFAQHINLNAERLRSQLVSHQDKLKLVVRRDEFM